jgi:hypothetical protein
VLGRSLGLSVGHGRERSSKITGDANGGLRRVAVLLGRARKTCRGSFIGSVARRGSFARPSWSTGALTWVRRRWLRAADRRPMADGGSPAGECARSSGASACARGPGTARPTWRVHDTTSRAGSPGSKTVRLSPVCIEFSPFFKQKCTDR